mmetsp:Transcript_58670/g.116498  ORF Transcript_58670/g.116498 Transcript_58670/m.116498 type:complete len:81 (-) Transcript_58670:449-691(-)
MVGHEYGGAMDHPPFDVRSAFLSSNLGCQQRYGCSGYALTIRGASRGENLELCSEGRRFLVRLFLQTPVYDDCLIGCKLD